MSSVIRGNDNFDSAYGAALKAWVNFDGTGTVAIRAALNVPSVTDNGTGDYTVNFGTALVDANYAATGNASLVTSIGNGNGRYTHIPQGTRTTGACRVQCDAGASLQDCAGINVSVFR